MDDISRLRPSPISSALGVRAATMTPEGIRRSGSARLRSSLMVMPTMPSRFHHVARPRNHVGKTLRIVRPLRHLHFNRNFFAVSHHADGAIAPYLVGEQHGGEFLHIAYRLAADAGDDLAHFEPGAVGSRILQ